MQTRQKTIHPVSGKIQQSNHFYVLSYRFITWYPMYFNVDVVMVLNLCHKTERRGNSSAWVLLLWRTNYMDKTVIFYTVTQLCVANNVK
jgi:hypothetical protein